MKPCLVLEIQTECLTTAEKLTLVTLKKDDLPNAYQNLVNLTSHARVTLLCDDENLLHGVLAGRSETHNDKSIQISLRY
jgi:hypothetical protein